MTSVCIHLDKKTKEKIDNFANARSLSRSSVIKLAVYDYFKNSGGNQ